MSFFTLERHWSLSSSHIVLISPNFLMNIFNNISRN